MKVKEREKFQDIRDRFLIMYEILAMSRNTLLFDKVLRPDQVGIVLDGVTKEAEKLLCEMTKLAEIKRN